MNHPKDKPSAPRPSLSTWTRLSSGLAETNAGGYAKKKESFSAPNASTGSDTTDHGINAARSRTLLYCCIHARLPPAPAPVSSPPSLPLKCFFQAHSKRTLLCAVL